MDYFKKRNSKMLIVICPTNGAVQVENLNTVCQAVELSGGQIIKPDKFIEDFYYGIIDRAEREREAKILAKLYL
jgi:hypothetical protein